jgi:hypothetical protein
MVHHTARHPFSTVEACNNAYLHDHKVSKTGLPSQRRSSKSSSNHKGSLNIITIEQRKTRDHLGAIHQSIWSPVITTRAHPVFKMVKAVSIPCYNLASSHFRYQLGCCMAVWTYSKVLSNSDWFFPRCVN